MFVKIKSISKDLFTGKDGESYDIGRVLGAMMVIGYLVNTGYAIHKGQPFDPSAWGIGCAAVLGGIGALLGLKAATEPGMPPAPVPPAEGGV